MRYKPTLTDIILAIMVLLLLIFGPYICGETTADIPSKSPVTRSDVFTAQEGIDKIDRKIRTVASVGNKKKSEIFEITAYDLSVASCGKSTTSRGYGITRSGKSLKGKTWKVRAIAVDPKVIKLETKVKITFTGWRSKYNGVYTAIDTGGAIKGHKIDLFLGENSYQECIKFGKVKAEVLK